MKQIDKIARELKWQFAGRYNDYYHRATICLDTDNDCLYVKYWAQGEGWLKHPKELIPLCRYSAQYGNWGDDYGNEKNWHLTKKVIAKDINDVIKRYDDETDDYFGKVNIPQWLRDEVKFYMNK